MKIKRYMAPDMRRAIQLVRQEEGADAVILSSRSVEGGVEIVAASDYDQQLVAEMSLGSSMRTTDVALEMGRAMADAPAVAETPAATAAGGQEAPRQVQALETIEAEAPRPTQTEATAAAEPARSAPRVKAEPDPALAAVQAQLDVLQGMLREQFAHLSWADMKTFQPERALLLREVATLDLDPELADELIAEVTQPVPSETCWREVVFGLARRAKVVARDPIEQGGVFALVGPTGVGKTTTLAKLAARHCLRHGRDSLALITTDSFRMAAQRQLDAYAEILGVHVHRAESATDLKRLLARFVDKRLVLIDTAGMAPRDCRLAAYLKQLEDCSEVRRYLVLSVNAQRAAMEDALQAFGGASLAGIAFTKLDEVQALGPALSMLIRSGLPAAWLCDGQRVPEDLKVARVVHLVSWAIRRPEAPANPVARPLAAMRTPLPAENSDSKERAHATV